VLISPKPDLLPFELFCSVQGTGGSPSGPYPKNRVGDQDTGSPGRPVSSGLQVPGDIAFLVGLRTYQHLCKGT
jgi:hypothetical protein